jgi:hypothetical protein
MICAFCGEEITDRPVLQDGQVYCSLGCADLDAERDSGGDYYDGEDALDLDNYEEDDLY